MRFARPAVALLVVAFVAVVVWWAWESRPVDPEVVDTVAGDALAAALAPDDALPLGVGRTSVVLVSVCTMRRERLEPYGHDRPTSPFLDALSHAGVTFDQVIAQAPWTRPSMGSLFTGRWPRVLKLDNPNNGKSFGMVLDESTTSLAEVLAGEGYRTIGAVANPNLLTRFGFAQGFDHYAEPGGTWREGVSGDDIGVLVDDVLGQVEATPSDRPVYVRLAPVDLHDRVRSQRRYRRLLDSASSDRESLRAYDAAVRSVDAELARLFVEMRRLRPDTLFIVAADHGEGLHEPKHHGGGHGKHLFLSAIRTPLLMHHPALPDPGRRVGGLAMNIDLHPTVLDLLGIPLDHEVDGTSQAAAVWGRSERANDPLAFSETFYKKSRKAAVYDGALLLVRDDRKRANADHLFVDFEARKNHASSRVDDATRLGDALTDWQQRVSDLAWRGPAAKESAADAKITRMLEQLGYVEDGD